MRLRIIFILSLFSLSLNASVLTQPRTYAMVFHKSYCERFYNAIENYMHTAESNGYSAFYLCTDTVDIKELKKRIEAAAENDNASFSEISGINLFGPVTSTKTIENLKASGGSIYPTSTLMAANIELILTKDGGTLVNIKPTGGENGYFSNKQPYIERWVSHMSPDKIDVDFPARLNELSVRIAPQGEVTAGENFKSSLQDNLSKSRTVPYYQWPDGEGMAIAGMLSAPALFIIGGLSRMREGYSFWNRFQTRCDKYGNSAIFLGLALLESISVHNYFNTEYYRPYDKRWKKVLLNKPLASDGLSLSLKPQ